MRVPAVYKNDLSVRVAGAVNGLALVAIMDVAVAANGGVGGPLIARDRNEAAGLVEPSGQRRGSTCTWARSGARA